MQDVLLVPHLEILDAFNVFPSVDSTVGSYIVAAHNGTRDNNFKFRQFTLKMTL